jgi:hypothetical protein
MIRSPRQFDTLVIPHRVQRKRTRGWKMPSNTIYVGRPSKWGNPYWPTKTLTLDDCLIAYKALMTVRIKLHPEKWNLNELKGKNLACWCALDKPCHADVLLKLLNAVSV